MLIKNVSDHVVTVRYGQPDGWFKEMEPGESVEVSPEAAQHIADKFKGDVEMIESEATPKVKPKKETKEE